MTRDRYHLLASRASLWIAPLTCVVLLGISWLIGRFVTIPAIVYYLIIALLALIWVGDLINVTLRSRRNRCPAPRIGEMSPPRVKGFGKLEDGPHGEGH